MTYQEPVNKEAHELLTRFGWKLLGSDDESGYQDPFNEEDTLIVSRSGAWRHIVPTTCKEHVDADGLPDELEEFLEEKKKEQSVIAIPKQCEYLDFDKQESCLKDATHYVIVEDNEYGGVEFYCEQHAREVEGIQ